MRSPAPRRIRRPRIGFLAVVPALAVALALAALSSACAPAGPQAGPDVVLITIDRLRWEELSPWGGAVQAPALAELSNGAARFSNAVSLAPGGAPAALTVLTGLPPQAHGVRVLDDGRLAPSAQSLADKLGARGWRSAAFLQSDDVTLFMQADRAFEVWDGPAAGFPTGHPGASQRRPAEDAVASGMHWLARLPKDAPGLLWLHLAEPAPPFLGDADRATRLGELDRLLAAILRTAKSRGEERGRAPILIACNLSSHGADPGRAAEEAFLLEPSALRVRLLVQAPGIASRDIEGLVGLDEIAPLAEALALGGSSRLLDMAKGGGTPRDVVVAETQVPLSCCQAEPLKVAVRDAGMPGGGSADAAVVSSIAADASWPGGRGMASPAQVLPAFLALDAAWASSLRGRGDEALAAFRAAAGAETSSPTSPGARAALGLILASSGQPAPALAEFGALRAEARQGSLGWTQARLGTALAASAAGDPAQARAALEEILATTRGDLRALAWSAATAEAAGDRAAAVTALLAIVEQDPDNPFALAQLGRLYMQVGRPRDAAQVLERALARQPTHPGLMLLAADALAASGDWWSAMDRINDRVTLYGASPETDLATADCWLATGRWEVAAEYYRRHAVARPDDLHGQLGLAESLLRSGAEPEGRLVLARARELASPGDPRPCDVLRRWAVASGRDPAAELAAAGCGG